jgi:hypothetical protein
MFSPAHFRKSLHRRHRRERAIAAEMRLTTFQITGRRGDAGRFPEQPLPRPCSLVRHLNGQDPCVEDGRVGIGLKQRCAGGNRLIFDQRLPMDGAVGGPGDDPSAEATSDLHICTAARMRRRIWSSKVAIVGGS